MSMACMVLTRLALFASIFWAIYGWVDWQRSYSWAM